MENNSQIIYKELETGDRECSEKKVRRGKKRRREDDSNHMANLTHDDMLLDVTPTERTVEDSKLLTLNNVAGS